jgi:hypothetical protein
MGDDAAVFGATGLGAGSIKSREPACVEPQGVAAGAATALGEACAEDASKWCLAQLQDYLEAKGMRDG